MFSEALTQRLVSVSADIADLRAWKQSVYLYFLHKSKTVS